MRPECEELKSYIRFHVSLRIRTFPVRVRREPFRASIVTQLIDHGLCVATALCPRCSHRSFPRD